MNEREWKELSPLNKYNMMLEAIADARHVLIYTEDPRCTFERVSGHLDRIIEDAWMNSGISEEVDLIQYGVKFMADNAEDLCDPDKYTMDPVVGHKVSEEGKKLYQDHMLYC